MRLSRRSMRFGALALGVMFAATACGPAAEPTATKAAATASTQPTATTAASAATATTGAADTKLRPVAVVKSPAPNPKAIKGGTFTEGDTTGNVPPDFSIWESAVSYTIQDTIPAYDTILEVNSYEAGKGDQILPHLAYDWWTDKTGSEWTLLLQKGVKFSDGSDLTCADVKFSLEAIRDTGDSKGSQLRRSPRAAYIRRVKEITCPDPHTVIIKTDGPLNSLGVTLSSLNFVIMPKATFEGNLKLMLSQIGPGSGPFVLDTATYKPGVVLPYKRNPNYWNQPYPYLDRVEFQFIGSQAAVESAFRVGRIDNMPDFSLSPSTRDEMSKSGRLLLEPIRATDGMTTYETNYQREPWKDARFMHAVRCVMDSATIIKTGVNGIGFEAPVFPLKETPGGTEWAMTKEQWKAIGPCHGPSAETDLTKRLQIAQDLMKQLGYGPNNLARPVLPLQDFIANREWPAVQQYLAKIWIEPKTEVMTYAQAVERATSGNFDMYMHGYITNRRDPDQWFYEQVYSTSTRNYGKYTNAEMDTLIDKMSREPDVAKRKQMVDQLSTSWLKDDIKIFVLYSASIPMYTPWVKDHFYTLPSNQQNRYHFSRTWIDPQAKKQALGQ